MAVEAVRARSKVDAVQRRLRALAARLGPSARLPTVAELCRRYAVSPTTLSAALAHLAADEVVVRRRGVGLFTAATLPTAVPRVVLLADLRAFRVGQTSPFWDLLIAQTQTAAAGRLSIDCQFIAAPPPPVGVEPVLPLSASQQRLLRPTRIDGVLGIGLEPSVSWWLVEQGLPLVTFAGPGVCSVILKHDAVMRDGVAWLAAQGCQRIGLWSPMGPLRRHQVLARLREEEERAQGFFRERCQAPGLSFYRELVRDNWHLAWSGQAAESFVLQGYRTALEVFGRSRALWPDGLLIRDDGMAQGALTALARLGVRVGKDIQIATHANRGSPTLVGYEDRLARLEFDPQEIAARMVACYESLRPGHQNELSTALVEPHLQPPQGGSATLLMDSAAPTREPLVGRAAEAQPVGHG